MTLCALSFDKQLKKQAVEMFTHFKMLFILNLTVESFFDEHVWTSFSFHCVVDALLPRTIFQRKNFERQTFVNYIIITIITIAFKISSEA